MPQICIALLEKQQQQHGADNEDDWIYGLYVLLLLLLV